MTDTERFMKIKGDIDEISNQKIKLEERFKTKKEDLEKLLAEIKDGGYDPKKLSEIRKEKEEQLEKLLVELESMIEENQEKLNLIEV